MKTKLLLLMFFISTQLLSIELKEFIEEIKVLEKEKDLKEHRIDASDIVLSKKYSELIKSKIPSLNKIDLGMGKKMHLNEYVDLLSQNSPYKKDRKLVNVSNSTITIEGCRPHSCDERLFLWINEEANKIIFSLRVFFYEDQDYLKNDGSLILIFSKDIKSKTDIPNDYLKALEQFVNELPDYKDNLIKRFLNDKGEWVDVL